MPMRRSSMSRARAQTPRPSRPNWKTGVPKGTCSRAKNSNRVGRCRKCPPRSRSGKIRRRCGPSDAERRAMASPQRILRRAADAEASKPRIARRPGARSFVQPHIRRADGRQRLVGDGAAAEVGRARQGGSRWRLPRMRRKPSWSPIGSEKWPRSREGRRRRGAQTHGRLVERFLEPELGLRRRRR